MARFATIDDLEKTLDTEIVDVDRATQQLDFASSLIQAYVGQALEYVADDVIIIEEPPNGVITLPERPVTDISSITLDGSALTEDIDYGWTTNGQILRRRLSTSWLAPVPNVFADPRLITITYSHGYPTIPDDIRYVCTSIAAHGWGSGPGGIAQESIGNYSVSYHGPGEEVGGPATVVILGKYRGMTLK